MQNPYAGNQPYGFIACAREDLENAAPYIAVLQELRCRLWFETDHLDENERYDVIAQYLKGASVCIAFLTNRGLRTKDIKREINYALARRIPIVCVYLEPCDMTPGMYMQIEACPSLNAWEMKSEVDMGGHIFVRLPDSVKEDPTEIPGMDSVRTETGLNHPETVPVILNPARKRAGFLLPAMILIICAGVLLIAFLQIRSHKSEKIPTDGIEAESSLAEVMSEVEQVSETEAEPLPTTEVLSEAEQIPEPEKADYAAYADIVRTYADGFDQYTKGEITDFSEINKDYMQSIYYLRESNQILFSLQDLNDDGTEELLIIGGLDQKAIIFDVFIMRDGSAEQLSDKITYANYRVHSKLCEGNVFAEYLNVGATSYYQKRYRLSGTDLICYEKLSRPDADHFYFKEMVQEGDMLIEADASDETYGNEVSELEFGRRYSSVIPSLLYAWPANDTNIEALREGDIDGLTQGGNYEQYL